MRDEGLKLAIEVAGGIGALARGLGIRQPSVSSWSKIPAERVLAIETVTGVRREQLRPDLYLNPTGEPLRHLQDGPVQDLDVPAVDEIEAARSRAYLMLATLLRSAPTAEVLKAVGALGGDETALGMARIGLAEAASKAVPSDVAAEYFSLFIGIGRGELLPYASYYLTGFLHERPLARLREDMGRLGIERAEGNFDPEDHLGLVMEIMGGFADGTFKAELSEQQSFFERHLAPWAERCLADIAVSPSAKFYKAVAIFGMRFLEIEREAFAIGE